VIGAAGLEVDVVGDGSAKVVGGFTELGPVVCGPDDVGLT
jgi:hypothetical protein